jgi:hypothetical protein
MTDLKFLIIANLLIGCASDYRSKPNEYIPSKGTITYVRPARLTNHGMVDTKYDIKFTARDGKVYTHTNCDISKKDYSINDTLTIYYNPHNPDDPIIDHKR